MITGISEILVKETENKLAFFFKDKVQSYCNCRLPKRQETST